MMERCICCCGRELDNSHDHNSCGPPIYQIFADGEWMDHYEAEQRGLVPVIYDEESDEHFDASVFDAVFYGGASRLSGERVNWSRQGF